MNLDNFSSRGKVESDMRALGELIVEPGSQEHQACKELVAFGRAYRLPGAAGVFAPERRVAPRASR